MLKVVFMGTPEFAVGALAAIHAKHRVVGVYTQPDKPVGRGQEMRSSPVKVRALELGLPVLQPEKLSAPGEFERLRTLAPDVIVIVAYGQILRRNVIDLARYGCVNIHSSLLPRWRGAAPIQWAILAGDAESGVTTMRIVEKLDAGDVLLQAKTPLSADETASTLHDRLARMGAELIGPTLDGLESGALKPRVQDEGLVTYAAKLTKEMEWLNPAESAIALGRRVRALNPWPGTSVWLEAPTGPAVRLKVRRATARADIPGAAGKIFERSGMLLLGTSAGSLELLAVQWEGKKEVDAAGFLNGLKGRGQALPLATQPPPAL